MKSRMTEESMTLLGGALLGAAALYFLDPQSGQRRRQRIVAAAEGAFGDARGRAGGLAAHLGSQAADAQHRAAEYARHLAAQAHDSAAAHAHHHLSHLHDIGGRLWQRASGLVKSVPEMAAEHADHLRQEVADQSDDCRTRTARGISRASHRAQSWLGHEENTGVGVGTLLSSTAGCCMVGAGLMYFLDPKQGRARRSWVVGNTASCIHRTGQAMRSIGGDLAHFFRGAVDETEGLARKFAGRARIDRDQLIRRIRAETADLSARGDQVQFMVDADGDVTVTGNVRREDIEALLMALHRIPGVEHVINRLTIRSETAADNRGTSAASAGR